MRVRVLLFVGVLACLAARPAEAVTQADADACNGRPPQYSDGQVIAACTVIIQSGQADSVNMSAFYANRGFAFDRQNDLNSAVSDYSRAIALDPANGTAYSNRGGAYLKLRNYSAAMSDLNQAVALQPGNPDAYYNRGLVYGAQEDPVRAIADYDRAISLGPQAAYYTERGRERLTQQDFEGAYADANQALALDPRESGAYLIRGAILSSANRFDEAIADIDQFIRLNPQSPLGPSLRSIILEEKAKAGH